jgi:hypothetical protein
MPNGDTKKMQDKAREGVQHSARAAADATQRAAGAVDQSVQTFADASTLLTSGFQEISREWLALTQKRLKTNLDGFDRLLGCRNVDEFLSIQNELIKSNLEQFLENPRRIAELSMEVMKKATSQASAHADSGTDQARRAA